MALFSPTEPTDALSVILSTAVTFLLYKNLHATHQQVTEGHILAYILIALAIYIAMRNILIDLILLHALKRRRKKTICIYGDVNSGMFVYFSERYKGYKNTDDIEIQIQTNGGSCAWTHMIMNILVNHKGRVKCTVSGYAFSSGTLIALSCSDIYMDSTCCLSKIDIQSLIQKQEEKGNLYSHEDLVEGAKNCDTVSGIEMYAIRKELWRVSKETNQLLVTISKKRTPSDMELIKSVFLDPEKSHDFPIFAEVLDKFSFIHITK